MEYIFMFLSQFLIALITLFIGKDLITWKFKVIKGFGLFILKHNLEIYYKYSFELFLKFSLIYNINS